MKRNTHKNISTLFSLVGLLGLLVVILLNHHQLGLFWQLVAKLQWPVLCVVVVVQLLSYLANAFYYRSILRVFTYHVSLLRLFQGALATNFVNYILPSVGLAGAGYLSQVLSPDVPRGTSVLAQLLRYGLSALAVLTMMPVGYLLIYRSEKGLHAVLDTGLWSTIAIIALAIVLIWLIMHEELFRRLVHKTEKILRRFFRGINIATIEHFLDNFYEGFRIITNNKRALFIPFYWSIIYIIIEILTFYLAFRAFGLIINPGIAILAYLFANIASIFGGVFFSTGVFELGMAGTLVALGIPLTQAVAVTVVYRVLNLLIGLPPGYVFYRKYLPS